MAFRVLFTPLAAEQLRALRAVDRAVIADQCERMLSVNPTLESKARVKHLRGNVFPPYRLRVGQYRVFYAVDLDQETVMIYGVVSKEQAKAWLAVQSGGTTHENYEAT
jgi:mRNA-degrading endonuclease RelE of RelBE toxin-antitoxin system